MAEKYDSLALRLRHRDIIKALDTKDYATWFFYYLTSKYATNIVCKCFSKKIILPSAPERKELSNLIEGLTLENQKSMTNQ